MSHVEEWITLCQQEAALMYAMLTILEDEQRVLIKGEEGALPAITERKNAALIQLAQQSERRNAFMQQQAIANPDSLYAWFTQQPPQVQNAWESLEASVHQVQIANQRNGLFLDQRMNLVNQSLDILLAAATETLGYNKEGQTQPLHTGHRFIGSA